MNSEETRQKIFELVKEFDTAMLVTAHPGWGLRARPMAIAETDEQALREARPHMEALANRFLKMPTEMLLPPGYSNIESMKRIRAAKITGKPQTLDDLVRNGVVIVGSPNTVREKLAEYQDLAGFNTSLTKTQFGTMADAQARANMAAIAQEVLPHFRERLPQGKRQAAAE